jgi:Uma2 family endonuclease
MSTDTPTQIAMLEVNLEELGIQLPPTQYELPYDDGVPMETQRHKVQMEMLIDTMSFWLSKRDDGYTSGNMFVYYSLAQVRNQDFKGPDFFVALDVPKTERLSWVVWEEGKCPDIVIELLSPSTAKIDKNEKKLIYQNKMRVPEYFWYDPFNPDDWAGFSLQNMKYEEIPVSEQQQLVSKALGLALVRWSGEYKEINTTWLRWAYLDGELIPTTEEILQQEKQRADQEKQRADQEQQRADQEQQRADQEQQRANQEQQRANQVESQLRQVAQNLLRQGMTVEQVASLTGLPESEVRKLMN